MRMTRSVAVTVILLAASGAHAAGSCAGSSISGVDAPPRPPERLAMTAYNAGLKHKQRALSYEAKAARAANARDRDKNGKKASAQFSAAIEDYQAAVEQEPHMIVALNEIGFAYRKLGDFDAALRAYDAALSIEPAFAPAIEYRAEAYLALGRFEDTKGAYLELYRLDQDHASLLMQAFAEWLDRHAADGTAESAAFAGWVEERRRIAEVTQVRPGVLQRTW